MVEELFFNTMNKYKVNGGLEQQTAKYLTLMKEHDFKTYLHELRVALIAERLANQLGYKDTKPEFFGGANHDIGKLKVKEDLLKSGEITEEEYTLIKDHVNHGKETLNEFLITSIIAGGHHHFQSGGYGLEVEKTVGNLKVSQNTKNRILDAAINVSLADYFDAMSTRKTSRIKSTAKNNEDRIKLEYPMHTERIDFLFSDKLIQEIIS